MFRLTFLIVAFGLASCGKPSSVSSPTSERPMRIVSLDFCADQYVLKLADREQILAVSPDAVRDFSYMRDTAADIPAVRSLAEDVLILKPDLIVRSYGGGPNATDFFARAGIPVLQVGWASTVHGEDVNSIPGIIQQMADGLGQSERGATLVESFQQRLAAIQTKASGQSTLYITPSGVTTGGNSLVHELMLAAGLENFADDRGWHSLPLERLAYERPDLVAAAYYDTRSNHGAEWSASRHPIARRELNQANLIQLKGAWIACGGWFALDAVEALAEGAQGNG